MTSIEDLQNEVAQLRQERREDRREIIFLRKELQKLQPEPQGQVFTLFPKLPKEVRLMIWDIILWTPQVIGVRQYFKDGTEFEED
jgi:hypothetical protein